MTKRLGINRIRRLSGKIAGSLLAILTIVALVLTSCGGPEVVVPATMAAVIVDPTALPTEKALPVEQEKEEAVLDIDPTTAPAVEAAPVEEKQEDDEEAVLEVEPTAAPAAETYAEPEVIVETMQDVLLTVLTGRVDYMVPGGAEWEQAIGEAIALEVGTQVRAYQLSSARLDLADGSRVLMKPVSRLGMTTYRHEPETPVTQAFVDIPEGEASFDVNGPLVGEDSSFLVKMPTGVFSVNPEADVAEEESYEPPPDACAVCNITLVKIW